MWRIARGAHGGLVFMDDSRGRECGGWREVPCSVDRRTGGGRKERLGCRCVSRQ